MINISRLRDSEGGFTLPEVLITIAILGILVAIAVPTWQSVVEGRRVDSATNQFASDLRLAHSRATNQLNNWEVRYTVGSSSYELVPDGGTAISRTLPENTVVSAAEVKDVSDNGVVVFAPDGRADPGAGMTFDDAGGDGDGEIDIEVTEDGDPTQSMSIARPTSRIEIDG